MKPDIGRIVLYRSRTGNYTVPAMVCAVAGSLHRPNVEAGYLDDLSSDEHVHLTVFTPGQPGRRSPDNVDLVDRDTRPVAPNVGGIYQEWNVEYWESSDGFSHGSLGEQPAGTWTWPPRV